MKDHDLESFQSELPPRYRIVRQIGAGGMATVFLAEDRKYARQVAIKVLDQNIALLLGRDRFVLEIKHTAQLSHPNILSLFDSDEAAGFLFYVMPYIKEGTLKDRLARKPQIPVAEAIAITRQVAAGLEHAHSLGVVHRDIKPANVLLAGDHAFIADFGIARIVRQAQTTGQTEEERLTEPGLLIGTPSYMPPEQLRGASQVDGRADEYSLACVLYEMLTGQPPSHDDTSPGAVRRALRTTRREVPARVAAAVERALTADRAGRFDRVSEFAEALAPVSARSRIPWTGLVAAAAAVGVVLAAWAYWPPGPASNRPLPDTTRYAFFPFSYSDSTIPRLDEEARLADAFGRWTGVGVVPPLELREELARQDPNARLALIARRVSRQLNAGRYVRGEVSWLDDSIRVSATLHDQASDGLRLGEAATITLGRDLAGVQPRLTELADRLLFRGADVDALSVPHATRSFPSRQAFLSGVSLFQHWQLARADTAFQLAASADPDFAAPALWLAAVRAWLGQEPPTWRYAIERAWSRRQQLDARDQAVAGALLAQSREDFGHACPIWRDLVRRWPDDFVTHYGAARCQDDDHEVIRDRHSPSGWRFRSSDHTALQEYQRAFALQPGILRSHRADGYRSLRRLFLTSGNEFKLGHAAAPDTTRFTATIAWQGDTLVFIPYLIRRDSVHEITIPSPTKAAAIRHQRDQLLQVARAWCAAEPGSPDALVALAVALELLGSPSAIDTLHRARQLESEPARRLAIAGQEVWLHLKFAWPGDRRALREAKRLADSLLIRAPPSTAPVSTQAMLAGLATLTGRAALAAEYSRLPGGYGVANDASLLVRDGAALLGFAALGGPPDSVLGLERGLLRRLDLQVDQEAVVSLRQEFLDRAATMAFPDVEFASLRSLVAAEDPLGAAIAAFLRGDSKAARDSLEHIRAYRASLDPATFSYDALYPEAALLWRLGDPAAAARWLDPSLAALERADASSLSGAPNAGSLMRTAILRAELALAAGDTAGARPWIWATAILWQDADPFLALRFGRLNALVTPR